MCICHRCDVPTCVNPDHLFVGTQRENMADRDAKGRGRKHKVTGAEIEEIKAAAAAGVPRKAIAEEYGVSYTYVHRVIHGERPYRPRA